MIKIISILLLLAAPFSLSAQKLSPNPVIITGRVLNYSATDHPTVITFNYCDPLSKDNRKAVRLSPSGEFRSDYMMHFSQNMTVKYGDEFINLFIHPNDSIDISIDQSKLQKGDWTGVVFSGDGAMINNQFAKFNDYLSKVPYSNLNFNLPPKEFIKEIKASIAAMEDSVNVYAKKNKLDPSIVKWAKRDIVYSLANRLLDYSRDNAKQRVEVLTDSIFDMHNQQNFQTVMFQFYLINTLSPLLMQDEEFIALRKSNDIEKVSSTVANVILKLPVSTSRDYLIYTFGVMGIRDYPDFYDKLPKDVFLNEIFNEKLKTLSQKYTSTDIEVKSIGGISYLCGDSVQSVQKQDIFSYFAKKYEGKVIYIDIWSTSCGACITQFTDAKELHKLYPDDVVFVNICLTSTLKSWLSTINNKKVEGENYYLDSDNSALFMDMCEIPGYPTYMLMNKAGKLVNKVAPQPQNLSKISELIDKLLK